MSVEQSHPIEQPRPAARSERCAAHTAQVVEAFSGPAVAPRTAEILRALVSHLHGFAAEVGLTRDEWMEGVRFLTAVGARCDDVRQEYILLSDTLGLSALLELIDSDSDTDADRDPGGSESTVLGPFYVADPPTVDNGGSVIADPATGGEPLVLRGRVLGTDGRPVPGAVVDVWQVQPSGHYDVEDDPAKRNLRARLRTDRDGSYRFETVRPIDYTVPDDGPVGAMMRSAGRHSWRPAHVHFRIAAPGYESLTTHLFDSTSPYLRSDAVFAVRPSLVVDLDRGDCAYDFVLRSAG